MWHLQVKKKQNLFKNAIDIQNGLLKILLD